LHSAIDLSLFTDREGWLLYWVFSAWLASCENKSVPPKAVVQFLVKRSLGMAWQIASPLIIVVDQSY
jgi:hypothetical protein